MNAAGQLEKPRRPITVRDLLLHTAGLSYGAGPAAAQWKAAGFSDYWTKPIDFANFLAALDQRFPAA